MTALPSPDRIPGRAENLPAADGVDPVKALIYMKRHEGIIIPLSKILKIQARTCLTARGKSS
jgi:hypothetical protein